MSKRESLLSGNTLPAKCSSCFPQRLRAAKLQQEADMQTRTGSEKHLFDAYTQTEAEYLQEQLDAHVISFSDFQHYIKRLSFQPRYSIKLLNKLGEPSWRKSTLYVGDHLAPALQRFHNLTSLGFSCQLFEGDTIIASHWVSPFARIVEVQA